jgi:hypothetical protein
VALFSSKGMVFAAEALLTSLLHANCHQACLANALFALQMLHMNFTHPHPWLPLGVPD